MNKQRKLALKSLILLFILVVFLLTACGGSVANNNWPGMTAGENNVIYVAYGPGIIAVDLDSQEQLWDYRPPEASASLQFFASPEVKDGQLVFGDYGASGGMLNPRVKVSFYSVEELFSLNPVTSWTQSEAAQDRIVAQALLLEDRVIVGTADNIVLALDRESGRSLWNPPFEAGHSIWGQSANEGDIIYVPSLDKSVYALDVETGKPLWSTDVGGSVSDKPVLNGDLLYVGSFDKNAYALDKSSGEIRWKAPAEGSVWGAPAYAEDTVFYADLQGNVYAVGAKGGESMWEVATGEYLVAAPVVEGDVVYVAAAGNTQVDPAERKGTLYAFSAETGDQLWKEDLPAPLFTTPVIVAGSIVVAMQTADQPLILEVFSLEDHNNSWTFTPEVPEEG